MRLPVTAARAIAVVLVLSTATWVGMEGGQSQATPSPEEVKRSPRFHAPGLPIVDVFPVRDENGTTWSSGEPSMGVSWLSNDAIMISGSDVVHADLKTVVIDADGNELRPDPDNLDPAQRTLVFQERSPPAWPNFDPMLNVHEPQSVGQPARVWAGGLIPATGSVMYYSDDEGITWSENPVTPISGGTGWDHQSIASGPCVGGDCPAPLLDVDGNPIPTVDFVTYYCAQQGTISCSRSMDSGVTWENVADASTGGCGGLHGHLRTAPDGTVYLPVKNCGFARSTNMGDSWNAVTVIGNASDPQGRYDRGATWDPSIGVSRDNGTLYFGSMQGDGPPHIAMSYDRGNTWEDVGQGNGAPNGTRWFNLGTVVNITHAVFMDVQAGDSDRAAVGFLGSNVTDPKTPTNSCEPDSDAHVWHYYLLFTYDAGRTWQGSRVTEDPVQRGGIWDKGLPDPGCRNLLDFNDLDIDSVGRVYAVFADGCLDTCTMPGAGSSSSRAAQLTMVRQRTGCGLFAGSPTGPLDEEFSTNPQCLVLPGPEAAFTCSGDRYTQAIAFEDLSAPDDESVIVDWDWDLGQGSTQTGPDPFTHAYGAHGTWQVNLTVTDAAGLSDYEVRDCKVPINHPPEGRLLPGAGSPGQSLPEPISHDAYETAVVAGATARFQVAMSDPDGDPVFCTLLIPDEDLGSVLGGSAYFDSDACLFTWYTTTSHIGRHGPIRVWISDGHAETYLDVWIDVRAPPGPGGVNRDMDRDGIPDMRDNCPATPNRDQGACDPPAPAADEEPVSRQPAADADGDSIPDDRDNCPTIINAGQEDMDQDGQGDACDEDMDGDGTPQVVRLPAEADNCPGVPNPLQEDADGDSVGDHCDVFDVVRPASAAAPDRGTEDTAGVPSAVGSAPGRSGVLLLVSMLGVALVVGGIVALVAWRSQRGPRS